MARAGDSSLARRGLSDFQPLPRKLVQPVLQQIRGHRTQRAEATIVVAFASLGQET